MITTVVYIACVGLIVSLYSYFIDYKITSDRSYKPFCDISDRVSCSKPINSDYAKLFIISNSTMGIVYYVSMIILAYLDYAYSVFLLSAASVCMSVCLAYILFWKIRSLCLVCTSIYAINTALLFASYHALK